MGWLRGFEPPTTGITIQYSNRLSYSHHREACGGTAGTGDEDRVPPPLPFGASAPEDKNEIVTRNGLRDASPSCTEVRSGDEWRARQDSNLQPPA